ncbi:MAG: acyl-CoA dehydrogenase family protein, partial [Candidatus Binatia bacterium]
MAIDFSFSPEIDELRTRMRDFIDTVVRPTEAEIDESDRASVRAGVIKMRKEAIRRGLWLPHMPKEWGGMGLGHVAMAMMSAEAARSRYGPFAINAQAPDEGNMHT